MNGHDLFYQKIKNRVSSRLLAKICVSQVFWEPIKNRASPRSALLEAVYLKALLYVEKIEISQRNFEKLQILYILKNSNPAENMNFFLRNYYFFNIIYVYSSKLNLNQEEKLLGNKVADNLKNLNGVTGCQNSGLILADHPVHVI